MRPFRAALLFACACAMLPLITPRAEAASPLGISLIAPIQFPAADKSVAGLRIDLIYGRHVDVTGLDWGLINHDTGNGKAFQYGLANIVEKDFMGWQDGVVNLTRGEFTGLQTGLFSSSHTMNGVMFGWINVAEDMHGLQLGLINKTNTMHGLQIGIANIITKGKIPFLPIVNWSM